MRTEEDIKAELQALKHLHKSIWGNMDNPNYEFDVWMHARFNLKTEKEKQDFDAWMRDQAVLNQIKGLEWALMDKNPRMKIQGEDMGEVPADVLMKIEFYHGIHTHDVCKHKYNLRAYYRDGNKERIEYTMNELRKYIPGI